MLLASATKALDEADLYRPLGVLEAAYVNSATVEERAMEREAQRRTVLFTDQPNVNRPGLAAMLSYIPVKAANGGGGGGNSSGGAGAVPGGRIGGAAPHGHGHGFTGYFDAIPEEVSAASLQYAADSPLKPQQPTQLRAPTGAGDPWVGEPGAATGGGGEQWFGPASGTIGAPSYDVVDYFSTLGQNADKKLFYLNARQPSGPTDVVSPFDLVVVPYERVDRGGYWTMSALGAVRVEAGRSEEGQFTPLGEWIRLSTVYGLLRKLRFFRHFRAARAFRHWRAAVQRAAFTRTRAALAARLLAADPAFQPCLLAAGRLVQQMRDTAVVAITPRLDRLYTLEEFVAEQDHCRTEATLGLRPPPSPPPYY
ncbi:hypothetical protein GPECTOR_63g5 [Gonium pectorale]|uniref:Uncharacterized protein n=1 Tax=Gonium pectorale TaxID=33097 RepID=A0A150G4H2_GONPE|nr:hypothetical protein GPECTOR_63g5 [Gonium pectorale]|eukprot:KXZ44724.1 hypothetical protein GPECTOR_63g5 [Gonium pectorale]